MSNDGDNKLGKRMSEVLFPTTPNEEEITKELQQEANTVKSRLWDCIQGDQIVTCHVPVKQTFEELLKKFEGNSNLVKEKSGLKKMMKSLSVVLNKYDEDRKLVCASYFGRKSFCSEEELMGRNFVESYKPQDYYRARLLAIEDEFMEIRQVAPVIINFRDKTEFDQLVSEIKAANFSPDEIKPLEKSMSRILESFEDLENLIKMTCLEDPDSYDYCQSIENQSAINSSSTEESSPGKEVTKVLEPKDENWEKMFPYDGPLGEADTEGRKAKYESKMQMLRDFSESLEKNLEKILTDFKSFWVVESYDYERYFVTKTIFKEIGAFMTKWEMNFRSGSQAYKLYEECEEEMWKVEEFAVEKCTNQDQKDEICLHFNFRDYEWAVKEFIEKAEAKLNLVSAEISDQDFEDLETMEERSRTLIELGRTYGGNNKMAAEKLTNMGQTLIDAMKLAC